MTHHPHRAGEEASLPVPRLIAWEITRRCSLRCRHCRASAQDRTYENELTREELKSVMQSVATLGSPILILTGGEPMLRDDLADIASDARDLGLKPVVATCGTLLTEASAQKLLESGVERISVSIDGADENAHDTFRGVPGAYQDLMRGIAAARHAGLPFQVNTTVTRRNADTLEEILANAIACGAVAFHPFMLVPTGRAGSLSDETLDAHEYEALLHRIYELSRRSPIPFKPTCAPHYYRVLRQREKAEGRTVTPQTHGLDAISRGCMGGTRFAFISHTGVVQICGFLETPAGDLRARNLDFASIWRESPLFQKMRHFMHYHGKCGICEYRGWCGGCRARAFAATGDYMDEEPCCAYTPHEEQEACKP